MKIPKKIKIGGFNWEVKEVGFIVDTKADALGRMNPTILTIEILKSLAPEQRNSVLLHEIIEAIDMQCDLDLDHKTICVLETMLYQVLKDNRLLC